MRLLARLPAGGGTRARLPRSAGRGVPGSAAALRNGRLALEPFGLFCKSFRRDLKLFSRLVDSVLVHGPSNLPFVACVPSADLALFRRELGERQGRLDWVTDEQVLGRSLDPTWHQQQIVKLQAWKLRRSRAFLVVDSDFCFVRDFSLAHFLTPDGHARWILSQTSAEYGQPGWDAPVAPPAPSPAGLPPWWRSLAWWDRWVDATGDPAYLQMKARIQRVFGRRGPDYHCMPGPLWTYESCRAFAEKFLEPRRLSYSRIIRYAPWEAVWMREFALAQGLAEGVPTPPFFLSFTSDDAVRHARARGLTRSNLPAHYLGVAVAAGHCTELF